VRILFDWLVVGQVIPNNPTAAVRGPKHVVSTGKTPVLAWISTGPGPTNAGRVNRF